MAELKRREAADGDVAGGEGQSGELKELIEHWIQVIDGWVQDLDQRMGGTAVGADPEVDGSPPDPAPRPAPQAPPVVGAG
jgi:hypothetical protein